MALVRVYCGLASADDTVRSVVAGSYLTIAVVDDAGRLLGVHEVSDDPAGYADLGMLLVERTSGFSEAAVAADSDDHTVTSLLTAAGRPLVVVDDDAADDFAERFADDDSAEEMQAPPAARRAVGLARALQAGAIAAVNVPAPRELASYKPVLAAHVAMLNGRYGAAVALREVLRELYPAALRAYPDPAHPLALAVLDALPEPGRLTGRGDDPRDIAEDVATELTRAGTGTEDQVVSAVTALTVAISESPRRGGVNKSLAPAAADAVRQAISAVRACDSACSALVETLVARISAPANTRRAAGSRRAMEAAAAASPVRDSATRVGRRSRPEPIGGGAPANPHPLTSPPVAPEPIMPPPLAPRPVAPRPVSPSPLAPAAAAGMPMRDSGPGGLPMRDSGPGGLSSPNGLPMRGSGSGGLSSGGLPSGGLPSSGGLPPGGLPMRDTGPGNRPVSVPPPPPGMTPITPGSRPAPGSGGPGLGSGGPGLGSGGPGSRTAAPGPRNPAPPADSGLPFRPTITNAAMSSARAERQRTVIPPRPTTRPQSPAASGATDYSLPMPTQRPTSAAPSPEPAEPGSRANWPLTNTDDLGQGPAPISGTPSSDGRVRPPWQDMPSEPPSLRLVESQLAGLENIAADVTAITEPPPLRLVDRDREPMPTSAPPTSAPPGGGPPSGGRNGRSSSRRSTLTALDRSTAPPMSAEGDGDLLIFAEARSAWFTGHDDPAQMDWTNPNDTGWRAAEKAATPAVAAETSAGLPKRVPQANLVPGSPLRDERPLRIVRDAASIAAHTTGYFRGWRRGQEIGGYAIGGRPGRESAGGWDFTRDGQGGDDIRNNNAGFGGR